MRRPLTIATIGLAAVVTLTGCVEGNESPSPAPETVTATAPSETIVESPTAAPTTETVTAEPAPSSETPADSQGSYPAVEAPEITAPHGQEVPEGVANFAEVLASGDFARYQENCWTQTPDRQRGVFDNRDEVLAALAGPDAGFSDPGGVYWGDETGGDLLFFRYEESYSPFACPTEVPGENRHYQAADASLLIQRLDARINGNPIHRLDTPDNYALSCPDGPFSEGNEAEAYEALREPIAHLAAAELEEIPGGEYQRHFKPVGQDGPVAAIEVVAGMECVASAN